MIVGGASSLPHPTSARYSLVDGVELIGEYQGSGLEIAPWLVRRPDGTMIQISRLLFQLAELLRDPAPSALLASGLAAATGRSVSEDNVEFLVTKKLAPLGLIADVGSRAHRTEPPSPPMLGLAKRGRLLPSGAVDFLGRLCAPLFRPAVVVAVVAGLVPFDLWLFGRGDFARGALEVAQRLDLFVALAITLLLSMAFHELGHVAACRYGGARPGSIGVGLYLFWPAFYADVTDAYRLDRRGRLRTDLGGLYFNAMFVLASAGVYWLTGSHWLLLAVVLQHLQAMAQLLPFLRLDGYYIMGDVTGVPNLFGLVGPVLRSFRPSVAVHPGVAALKPSARRAVCGWVLLALGVLVAALLLLAKTVPAYASGTWIALVQVSRALGRGWSGGEVLTVAGRLFQLIVLAMLPLGVLVMFARCANAIVRRFRRRPKVVAPSAPAFDR